MVDGALRACNADPELHLLLVGPQDLADGALAAFPAAARARVGVRRADAVAGMTDTPLRAVRQDTTVRAAVSAIADGAADALVTAGASGAAVAAAVVGLGRWVRRPALAATLPSFTGPVVLLDVGASPEAALPLLVQHAVLGAAYTSIRYGIEMPRVGLLSLGAEAGKGDALRVAAAGRIAELELPGGGRFVGNVEGHDVSLGGRADVVVTDGFTGNVLLKGIEGAYALAGGQMSRERAPRAAVLLGVHGTTVVCHGAAVGEDVASGIALAAQLCRIDAVARISATAEKLVEVS